MTQPTTRRTHSPKVEPALQLYDTLRVVNLATTVDPAAVSRHSYLGEVDDVNTSPVTLIEGQQYTVPSISRQGLVLFPGMILPLKVIYDSEEGSLERALAPASPLRGCIVVEPSFFHGMSDERVGCLAVIRQVGRNAEGELLSVIAQGRQRVSILSNQFFLDTALHAACRLAEVRILSGERVPQIPKEAREGLSHWAPWAVHQLDPYFLAEVAYNQAQTLLTNVRDLRDDPNLFSYWLAASLPIDCERRQTLLAEDNVAYRLRAELQLLKSLSGIFCHACQVRLANVADVMSMSELGSSEVFVNTHGYVHDLITLRHVQQIKLQGNPVAEHSWFPGFEWTLAHCAHCLSHVGWRFTAGSPELRPHCFWGLSRAQITHKAPGHAA